jgi:hypothetical protein
MDTTNRVRCPACGFAIFNRRVATCESCLAALPAELLYSPEELERVEADHAEQEKIRQEMAKAEQRDRARDEVRKNRVTDT